MKLLVHIEGIQDSKYLFEIAKKALPVFNKHDIHFEGNFTTGSTVSLDVNQYKNMIEVASHPVMWIIGLNQNEWFGDRLKALLGDMEEAMEFTVYSATN